MTTENLTIFANRPGNSEADVLVLPRGTSVRELLAKFATPGALTEEILLFQEDMDEPLGPEVLLVDIEDGKRNFHTNRHRKIKVTVHYNGEEPHHEFSPGSTVRRVKEWAEHKFHIHDDDTVEYSLQICGTKITPPEHTHVGSLLHGHECELCFELRPHPKVHG
jgi:hypothetical protein